MCLDLLSALMSAADLAADPSLVQLAIQLFQLAVKHKQYDADHAAKLLETIRFRAGKACQENDPFRQLASILRS